VSPLERAGLPLLRRLDPETAHGLALRALRLGLGPRCGPATSPRLATKLAGIALPNPLGLAAGFDKDGVALRGLAGSALGFVEVGAVTPRAQAGNPRPRLWRLPPDGAINRFGFNNRGMEAMAARLERRRPGVVGVNLGANKDSEDRAGDFAAVLRRLGPLVDFATVNVSSPNTSGLRDLQGRAALQDLLARVMDAGAPCPVFLKLSPDLHDGDLADAAEVAERAGLVALVATNTTLARDGLSHPDAARPGGLSGRPLFDRSTRVLARLASLTSLPLIGVGGVASGEDAFQKLRAGATAVQLYTGLAYGGLSLARRILHDLDAILRREGFATAAEAVGTGRADWL
jgi:dihydroorotate dehydrogenase